jgi:hypothetical protein
MDYSSGSSISAEIADLAPNFKAGIYGKQWPFLDNGRFGSRNGLARLCLAESENPEVIEALGGLL